MSWLQMIYINLLQVWNEHEPSKRMIMQSD